MQAWMAMVLRAVFCFRKNFGEILHKIGEISSQPSGNTANRDFESEAKSQLQSNYYSKNR